MTQRHATRAAAPDLSRVFTGNAFEAHQRAPRYHQRQALTAAPWRALRRTVRALCAFLAAPSPFHRRGRR